MFPILELFQADMAFSTHDRRYGLRMTPQRMAIMEYLMNNLVHPSARDIYDHVRTRFPSLSFATVYNTLQTLKDRGIVLELTIDPRERRYDARLADHHHMFCAGCREIRDLHVSFDLSLPKEKSGEFSIISNRVEFIGLCGRCKGSGKRR